ncbi:hypothetical protein [Pseudorhizobium marinum]|uniref:hypothetical protein n=1 Tax=Pseudorhizobium marinum TaxID=1496690 RepID=UPI0012DF881F|nr:hypothetical protein [Pseudorhizobium marinum]
MLELNVLPFLGAIVSLRTLIERTNSCDPPAIISDADREFVRGTLSSLPEVFSLLGCRSAKVAAERLYNELNIGATTYGRLATRTGEIESRFADELSDVKFLVLQPNEAGLMLPVDALLGAIGPHVEGFPAAFPKASQEIEESAKCIALNRYTASVFHCMRALECGIGAFAKLIEIADPAKPAAKNWGIILQEISKALDEKWPRSRRIEGTLGAEYEKIYATLDAVKNPWRNATMHVTNVYSPHEALHIARCTAMFLVELAKHCDEEGRSGEAAPALAEVNLPDGGSAEHIR